MTRFDTAIIGSGFGGTILARCLAASGQAVALIERRHHPRFALGESSTPLAALSLDRIATRFGLPDLAALGSWGRWRLECPQLNCGLKRGFTFYRHHPDSAFSAGPRNENRLMVAASSSDEVADVHWLRSTLDADLVRSAIAEGVSYFDGTEVVSVGNRRGELRIETSDGTLLDASTAIDASGRTGLLTSRSGHGPALETRSGLVFAHLRGSRPLEAVAGPLPEGAPYPEHRAAVHHITDSGWAYELRFDDGLVSAGMLTARPLEGDDTPLRRWTARLERHPTLARMFETATFSAGPYAIASLQYRHRRVAGTRWAALPHSYAFVDPLFSTGIAWTLRCVERLAGLLVDESGQLEEGLRDYSELVELETEQIDRLVAGAYRAMHHFDLFTAWTMLYFTEASFAEARERLSPKADDRWRGFLAADEPERTLLVKQARHGLERALSQCEIDRFTEWLQERCAPRNVAGLFDSRRANLYPVDLEELVTSASKLGLREHQVLSRLPALRAAGQL